jgi:hypothetical protein
MADAQTASELLADLKKTPGDDKLREDAARALLREGDPDAAYKTLLDRMVNVTAHAKGSPLPSLHRKAIKPAVARVELDGEAFVREFVCAQGRVLFFWLPELLAKNADEVRDSVRERLDRKLESYDRARKRGRPGAGGGEDE